MRRFDNISAMVEASLQAGLVVETRRYSTGAGGGVYDILTLSQFQSETGSIPDEIGDLTVANGTVAKLRKTIIDVAQYGVLGDGSTDDTLAAQAAFDAGINNEVCFGPGTFTTTIALDVSTGTTISGIYGQSIMRPSATYTGLLTGSDGAIFRNENFFATELTDKNIIVQNMAFDWSLRDPVPNAQAVSTFMRYVTNVKTLNCVQSGGENMTGFLKCSHTWIEGNFCAENKNAAYDQWSSTGHIIVSGNINHSVTVAPNQCIQLTGDDTDPVTTEIISGGLVTKAIISGNIIDVPPQENNSGIILNDLTGTSIVQNITVADNFVKGPTFGIVLQGATNNINITDNTVSDIIEHGLLVFDGGTGGIPSNWKVEGNMFNECSDSTHVMDIRNANNCTIRDNTINGGDYGTGINVRAEAANIVVADNRVAPGSVTDINNLSNTCFVSTPRGVQWRKPATGNHKAVDAETNPPTTYTDVDVSSIVGLGRQTLLMLRVGNALNSATWKFSFIRKGNPGDPTNPLGAGAGICEMQSSEHATAFVMTDESGVFQWRADQSATSGTVSVLIDAYVAFEQEVI